MVAAAFNRYDTIRRTVASAALNLAFRRYLGENGVLFGVQEPTPFSDPDRYDLLLGGRTCELKTYLISRASQWQALSDDPRLALAAPALVPLDRHTTDTVRARDIYVFAFVGARVASQEIGCLGPGSATRRVLDARNANSLAGWPTLGAARPGRSQGGGNRWTCQLKSEGRDQSGSPVETQRHAGRRPARGPCRIPAGPQSHLHPESSLRTPGHPCTSPSADSRDRAWQTGTTCGWRVGACCSWVG